MRADFSRFYAHMMEREGFFDYLRPLPTADLNATLGSIDSDGDADPDFDTTKVSVTGVSLGGIVTTTFTTVNQLVIANETMANAQISAATGGSAYVAGSSIAMVATGPMPGNTPTAVPSCNHYPRPGLSPLSRDP